jgi:hypothetical protein
MEPALGITFLRTCAGPQSRRRPVTDCPNSAPRNRNKSHDSDSCPALRIILCLEVSKTMTGAELTEDTSSCVHQMKARVSRR